MGKARKQEFEFRVFYYSRGSGSPRFSARTRLTVRVRADENSSRGRESSLPNLADAAAVIRGLRDSGGPGALPGFSAYDDGWAGSIIIVADDDGTPFIIHPPGKE